MWDPSQQVAVALLAMRELSPLGRASSQPDNRHLSRASHVGRMLRELPRVNLLLVGVDREVWHLLDTRSLPLDLREPIAIWSPGEPLVLPPLTQLGTLILHDVGALSTDDQRHLLKWLEPAGRRVQVISTTPVSLFPRVEAGSFNDTLYYRLNTMYLDMTSPVEAV